MGRFQQILGSCSPDHRSSIRCVPSTVFKTTLGNSRPFTSPTRTAPVATAWFRMTSTARSGCPSGTNATNRPSFATYNGSNPSSSQAPCTSSRIGIARSSDRKLHPGSRGDFVEGTGKTPSGQIPETMNLDAVGNVICDHAMQRRRVARNVGGEQEIRNACKARTQAPLDHHDRPRLAPCAVISASASALPLLRHFPFTSQVPPAPCRRYQAS